MFGASNTLMRGGIGHGISLQVGKGSIGAMITVTMDQTFSFQLLPEDISTIPTSDIVWREM